SSLMISPDSAQARQPNAGPPPDSGYWLVAADGGVFPFGREGGYGSTGAMHLNRAVVGAATTPDHLGYWLVASDGGIVPFRADGGGYWLVAGDGVIFPFGDAPGYGSTGAIRLLSPIVGIAATPSGHGYWLAAADSGIFPFGDAPGYGSLGGLTLARPVVSITAG